jgi:asparagine synthase (glutamine-hydrolysing)
MSGIGAVWRRNNPARAAATASALSAALGSTPGDAGRSAGFPLLGVAVVAQGSGRKHDVHEDPRVFVACDVDLLNENELRRSCSLTEESSGPAALLSALYERRGLRFVEQLRGAFSFVLWDGAERRLIAAIDPFGIKRLVWYRDGDALLIASRVDAIRAAAPALEINPRAVQNLVNFSSILAPDTIFRGVERLMPGTLLVASHDDVRTESYWEMRYGQDGARDERRLARELQDVLEGSVAAHQHEVAGGHCGAFLSGGTDSSTVVGLMTRTSGAPAKAFSIGFEEPGFSELEFADIAARQFGSEHHTYLVNARDCVDALPAIVRAFDEPFGNSSAVATYFCARLAASAGVTTLLAGDGGDELFGGNERYALDKVFESYFVAPRWMRAGLEASLRVPLQGSLLQKARGYVRRANLRGIERMLSFQFLRTHDPREVFDASFIESLDGASVLDIPEHHYTQASAREHLDRLLFVDMKITLADNDLPKVTRMSELAGVETRFPFLDRSVAEFAGRVPARLKVKGFQKRYLFKRAFEDLLPREILQKKKHGFGIPVALWMRSDPAMRELAHDTLMSARAFGRGYFRKSFIEDLFQRHQAGVDTFYGDTLWTFLMLELWHREVVDEPVRGVA